MKISVFGDSIAWGACDEIFGGWVNRLETFLKANNFDIEITNHSICGETTETLMFHFQKEANAQTPDIIIIAIGINDARYYYNTTHPETELKTFKSNIIRLKETAEKISSKTYFIGLTTCDEKQTNPCQGAPGLIYENTQIALYNQTIKDIANQQFIEIENITEKDLTDGLHPSAEGHQKIYETIKVRIINDLKTSNFQRP